MTTCNIVRLLENNHVSRDGSQSLPDIKNFDEVAELTNSSCAGVTVARRSAESTGWSKSTVELCRDRPRASAGPAHHVKRMAHQQSIKGDCHAHPSHKQDPFAHQNRCWRHPRPVGGLRCLVSAKGERVRVRPALPDAA